MGLFDWVMKGIGFESDDEGYENQDVQAKKPKKEKKKRSLFKRRRKSDEFDDDLETVPSSFDKDQYNAIREDDDSSESYTNSYSSSYGGGYSSFGNGTASYGAKNFVFFNPGNYEEIKRLVEYLKQGEPAIVNLDKITENEAQRSLDFISGAACALGGKLQRITGNYFLVTPDGYNITKPSGQDQ